MSLTSKQMQTKVVLEEALEVKQRKQVGLLGGSFNPVHLAHLVMADQVGRSLGLDKVSLMPSYESPHVDHKEAISAAHRLKMLQLALEDNDYLDIEMIELIRKGKSYTYDTMKLLKEREPQTDFYFIIGGDMVAYLPKWHRIDELMELVNFVGVKRPGYDETSPYPIIWVDVPQISLSSTKVRQKIAQGCSLKYLVPDKVLDYIHQEGLYLDDK